MKRYDLELRVLFAVALLNGIADSAILPLIPTIKDDLGLTPVQTGLVWTTTTLAMLVAALPVGYATNRFGSRVPLLVSAALMPLALVGQGLAGNLEVLLASRFVFGISFGILWVIGPVRSAAGGRGAGGTGALIAVAGVGWLIGPLLTGAIADLTDWRVASLVVAALTVPTLPLVYRYAAPRIADEHVETLRLRVAFDVLRHNRTIVGAALVSALLGIVGGASNVLVPLALDREGLSAGGIGIAFAIASAVWIAAATLVGRLRASAVSLRGVGVFTAVLAVVWLLPALRLTVLALATFLVVSTAVRAILNALNYAVGVRASLGNSASVVIGVLNLTWAVMALVSPLLAGLAEGSSGVRIAFALIAVCTGLVALVLLAAPRPRVGAQALSS